jgi:hypothetical protein
MILAAPDFVESTFHALSTPISFAFTQPWVSQLLSHSFNYSTASIAVFDPTLPLASTQLQLRINFLLFRDFINFSIRF